METGKYGDNETHKTVVNDDLLHEKFVELNNLMMRNANIDICMNKITAILNIVENSEGFKNKYLTYLFLMFIYIRDIKNGKGERKLFYDLISKMPIKYDNITKYIVYQVVTTDIGSYADILRCVKYFNYIHDDSNDKNIVIANVDNDINNNVKDESDNIVNDNCNDIINEECDDIINGCDNIINEDIENEELLRYINNVNGIKKSIFEMKKGINDMKNNINEMNDNRKNQIKLVKNMLDILITKLKEEQSNMLTNGKTPSLISKWAPKEGSIFDKKHRIVRYIANSVFEIPSIIKCLKAYRKFISSANKQIELVEVNMCGNTWDKIDPHLIPNLAKKKYNMALLNKKKDGSIKSESIIRRTCADNFNNILINKPILRRDKSTIYKLVELLKNDNVSDLLLNELNKFINDFSKNHDDKFKNTLCIVDTSISMDSHLDNVNTRAIDLAIGMTLMISNINNDVLSNKVMSFSEKPQLYDVTTENIILKIKKITEMKWSSNTNMELIFEKLLSLSVLNGNSVNIIIFSDVNINKTITDRNEWEKNYHDFEKMFNEKNLKMPNVTYWNFRNTDCVVNNIKGINVISGINETIIEEFMSGKFPKNIDPWTNLKSSLDFYSNLKIDIQNILDNETLFKN